MIKLNEMELSKVNGGGQKWSNFKSGFKDETWNPVCDLGNIVTLDVNAVRVGRVTGAATLIALGALAPWACRKLVQLKSLIFK